MHHEHFRLKKSTTCPMTNAEISPEMITTPSRLVLSILAGLDHFRLESPRYDVHFIRYVVKGI